MGADELWSAQLAAFGAFLRAQRRLANLSLREVAARTNLSNAYLSQIERGLHTPSVRVLRLVADALDLSTETLLTQAGFWGDEVPEGPGGTRATSEDTSEESAATSSTRPSSRKPVTGFAPRRAAGTEAAIRNDALLTQAQKEALLSVYRSYIAANDEA